MADSPYIVIGLVLALGAAWLIGWIAGRRFNDIALQVARDRIEAQRNGYQLLNKQVSRLANELADYKCREEERHAARSEAVRKGHATRRANRAAKKASA